MTAGYDPTGSAQRPGPHPPAGPVPIPPYPPYPPVQPAPAQPLPPQAMPPQAMPPQAVPPQPAPTQAFPAQPVPPVSSPVGSWSAPPFPGASPYPTPFSAPVGAAAGSPQAPQRPRPPIILSALVILLLLAVGGEGYLLNRVNDKLNTANQHLAANRIAASQRADGLENRVKALEQRLAGELDSTAVANAVLPSVFRVDAGEFTGTAFAVGKAPAGGGTDLITNYHVIQSIYGAGTKDAALERDNQRFPVKITQVDQKDDLALLHSTETFKRLTAASTQVQSGAPIVVVGAPLGLAQTVTTGVVSAIRNDFPGEGGKTYIQFDAPINPGNSGGPVVNAQQQVVGIASAKANNAEGIGLAIPIALACQAFSIC